MKRHETAALEAIARWRYCRVNFLGAVTGGYYDYVRREVYRLVKQGILRVETPVYFKPGAAFPTRFHGIYSIANGKHYLNEHDLMVADIGLSLEAAARVAGLTVRHKDDILAGLPFVFPATIQDSAVDAGKVCTKPVEPDALIAINETYLAIEAVRYSEQIDAKTFINKKSMRRSLLQYRDILKNQTYKQWGLPHLKVLFVFDSVERMRNTMQLMEEDLKFKSGSIVFYAFPELADMSKSPTPLLDILSVPGARVGHEPFYLRPQT